MDKSQVEKSVNRLISGLTAGLIFKGADLHWSDLVVYDVDYYTVCIVEVANPFNGISERGRISINGGKEFEFYDIRELGYEEIEERD